MFNETANSIVSNRVLVCASFTIDSISVNYKQKIGVTETSCKNQKLPPPPPLGYEHVHAWNEDTIFFNLTGPEVIKLFSCSTQLSMKFFPLIYVKMPTIVGILTCMSGKNNILGLTEP